MRFSLDLKRNRSKAQRTLVKSVSWCGRCRRSEQCSPRSLYEESRKVVRIPSCIRNEILNSLCACPQGVLFYTRSYPLVYDTSIQDVWVVSRIILIFPKLGKLLCLQKWEQKFRDCHFLKGLQQ